MGGGELRVNVIDADELVLDEKLPFLGLRDGQVGAVLEDFGAARLLDEDAPHGFGDGGGCHGAGCQGTWGRVGQLRWEVLGDGAEAD